MREGRLHSLFLLALLTSHGTSECQSLSLTSHSLTRRKVGISCMIIMNKRTVLEIFPQSVTNLISEWQLRVLVLVSLFVHIMLVLLGSRRKYRAENWFRSILGLFYSPSGLIVAVTLGLLSKCQGCEDNSSQQRDLIQAFWVPFLLVQLGGADTITAYSLEDIELWKRFCLELATQSGTAFAISLSSWKGMPLNFLAIPMYVAGLTKCGEKTLFLRSRSNDHFRNTMIPRPDPGPNYFKFMEKYDCKRAQGCCDCKGAQGSCVCKRAQGCFDCKRAQGRCDCKRAQGCCVCKRAQGCCDCKRAQGCCVSLQPIIENFGLLNIITSPAPRNKSIPDAILLQKANEFFSKFQRLFTDLVLEPTDLEQSKSFFKSISWTEALKVIEIELGFMYDMLYTKAMVAYPKWGGPRRFFYLFLMIPTFMIFLIIDRHELSTIDVIITFLLLVEAIFVEIYSIIVMFSSDWTMTWLSTREKTRWYLICQAITSCRVPYLFPENKRWSDSMGKHSLVSDSLKKLPIKFSEVWKFSCICQKLEECSSKHSNVVPQYLKRLIFEQLKEKSTIALDIEATKQFCARRGDWTLEKMNCFGRLGWSIGGEFDKSILLWHLATDLCYYTDLNKNSSPVKNSNCKSSKLLSDYMVHLLVKRPLLLPEGIGKIRFQDTRAEAIEFFQSGKRVRDRIQACKKLLQVNTEIPPAEVKGNKSKSVLLDACRLAKSLQSLETEKEWGCERKWEMMSHVWVEMLCYAACHCPRNQHAKQLSHGGELLTHVWLLMTHFGITELLSQG